MNLTAIYKEKSIIFEFSSIIELNNIELIDFIKLHGTSIEYFTSRVKGLKEHVVVIGGGMSSERLVSYMSSNSIVRSLIELNYHVTFVDMGTDIALVLLKLKPDIVFNALHGKYGEDGCLPGLLNIMHIPYTGPGVLASAAALNKSFSYQIFQSLGIKVPESKVIKKSYCYTQDPIKRPYVIKPLSQGSSIGVKIVFPEDVFSFENYDFIYGEEVIIEQYIKGKEMQVAVLNGRAIGVLEIELLKNKRFYDYETKYTKGFAKHLLPAPIPLEIYNSIKIKAEESCRALNCTTGIIRVEMIYSVESNIIYMLEVNTHPGMTPLSICPEIVTLENMSYNDLVEKILETARFE